MYIAAIGFLLFYFSTIFVLQMLSKEYMNWLAASYESIPCFHFDTAIRDKQNKQNKTTTKP